MSAPGAPLEIAQAVARHVAPIAGILFLGWSASNVLLLYFTDTLFAIAVMMAGLLRHFSPPVPDDGWAARLNGEVGVVGGGLFIAAIFVLPLGFPLVFMLGGFDVWKTLADPALRAGLAWQAVAALWSYAALYRELRRRTPAGLRVKRRFTLVLLRWILLIMIAGTGVGALLGSYGALLFVVAYAALSIWIEVAPDRFLRMVPGDSEQASRPARAGPEGARRRDRRAQRR
jgi:hypothetical protein